MKKNKELKLIKNLIEYELNCKVKSFSEIKDTETNKLSIIFNTDLPDMTTDEIYNINKKFYNIFISENFKYIYSIVVI